ncbi:MAG: hypothetical protein OSB00_06570 [Sphingomonas bacterium]|nr:hypothetical protein [Sphingomonas bacterium]
MADTPDHVVVIRPEPFGVGYDVTVEPSPAGDTFDKEYPTFAGARGYARGLRLYRGWPIRDETGEGVV